MANIPITTGTGTASVATETVGGISYQQIEVLGKGGASVLAVNPDGSMSASVIGTVTTKVSDGTSSANFLSSVGGSNSSVMQGAMITAGAYLEVPFNTSVAAAVAVTDVSNYKYVSVHMTAIGTTSTNTYQVSNDGVNWVSLGLLSSAAAGLSSPVAIGGAGSLNMGPIASKWFRINVTGITSASTVGVVEFYTSPTTMPTNLTGTVLADNADSVAVSATANKQATVSRMYVFNSVIGSWDRLWGTSSVGAMVTTGKTSVITMISSIATAGGTLPISGSITTLQGTNPWIITGSVQGNFTTGNSSVQVLNFPANQSVSGTVAISGSVSILASASIGGSAPSQGIAIGLLGNNSVFGSWQTLGSTTTVASNSLLPVIAPFVYNGVNNDVIREGDVVGYVGVTPYTHSASIVSGTSSIITGTTQVSVLAAAGGGQRNYITAMIVTNQQTSVTGRGTQVNIIDDGSGQVMWSGWAASEGGGWTQSFPVALKQTTSTFSVSAKTLAQASVLVALSGYTAS